MRGPPKSAEATRPSSPEVWPPAAWRANTGCSLRRETAGLSPYEAVRPLTGGASWPFHTPLSPLIIQGRPIAHPIGRYVLSPLRFPPIRKRPVWSDARAPPRVGPTNSVKTTKLSLGARGSSTLIRSRGGPLPGSPTAKTRHRERAMVRSSAESRPTAERTNSVPHLPPKKSRNWSFQPVSRVFGGRSPPGMPWAYPDRARP